MNNLEARSHCSISNGHRYPDIAIRQFSRSAWLGKQVKQNSHTPVDARSHQEIHAFQPLFRKQKGGKYTGHYLALNLIRGLVQKDRQAIATAREKSLFLQCRIDLQVQTRSNSGNNNMTKKEEKC